MEPDVDIAGVLADALDDVSADTTTMPLIPDGGGAMLLLCGKRQGTEVCDRIAEHGGECSWHSDIVLNMMATQVAWIYATLKPVVDSLPPGMIPGLT